MIAWAIVAVYLVLGVMQGRRFAAKSYYNVPGPFHGDPGHMGWALVSFAIGLVAWPLAWATRIYGSALPGIVGRMMRALVVGRDPMVPDPAKIAKLEAEVFEEEGMGTRGEWRS